MTTPTTDPVALAQKLGREYLDLTRGPGALGRGLVVGIIEAYEQALRAVPQGEQTAAVTADRDPLLLEVLNFIELCRSLKITTGGGEYTDTYLERAEIRRQSDLLYKKLEAMKWGTVSPQPSGELLAALKTVIGYHLNADSYRDTFPDDAEDGEYLRKQETYHRLQARQFISEELGAECLKAMKKHASKDPALVAEIECIKQGWKT